MKSITVDDIEKIVVSAREMNRYLNEVSTNYTYSNIIYRALQFICGFGSGQNREDFLELKDDDLIERIHNVIKTGHSMRSTVTASDFMYYWDDIIYMCKFPKHTDTEEIKSVLNEEILESLEYNTFISRDYFDYDVNQGSDDWGIRIPNPMYVFYISVELDENIELVANEIREQRKHTVVYGYEVSDNITPYESQNDAYGGVCIRVSKI